MRGMVGARDSAVRIFDLADGHARFHERDVDGTLDVARGGLDADAKVIRRSGYTAAECGAFAVDDERGGFRRASVDAEEILGRRTHSRLADRYRCVACK